jgi:cytochrome c biogenesis protein CcmG/thiol:disulfide interchange protein DsbE
VLILVAVGVLAFRGGSPTAGAVTNPAAFSLPTLNGNGWVRLARYRGKPVAVNFFASWCTACQAELPGFKQEADALKGKVTFIGVDSLETGDKNFLPNLFHLAGSFAALARDVGPDGNGLHAALGGGNTMPLTAFYGADGKLLDVERGALVPAGALQAKIAQLFGITT